MTTDQAAEREDTCCHIDGAVVGACAVQADYTQGHRVDGQDTVDIAKCIVAGSQATRREHVTASIDGTLRSTAVGQSSAQYGRGLAADKAAVAHTIATAVSDVVVGLAGVVGGDGEAGWCDAAAGVVGVADRVICAAVAIIYRYCADRDRLVGIAHILVGE